MPIAVVTGASRGVGRGVALALSDAGFTVHATGRTIDAADLPASIIRHRCDHTRDDDTAGVFERVAAASAGLDVLVNSAWGGYEKMVENGAFTWGLPFWEQPAHRWTGMIDAGVRAAYACSAHAARLMLPQRRGVIVNISFWPAQKYIGNAIYGVAKAATDKLTSDTAHELRPHGVTVLSLYPGLVRTEAILAAAGSWLDLSNSESPEFIGRVIAALTADPRLLDRSGEVIVAADAARFYGVTDEDGRQPRPLTLADV
jgi:dehydrogenase/reductase SDR family protein 1